MLRPIPEDRSDDGATNIEGRLNSFDSLSAAATSINGEGAASVISDASAVLALNVRDDDNDEQQFDGKDGLISPSKSKKGRSRRKRRPTQWSTWRSFAVLGVVFVMAVVIVMVVLSTTEGSLEEQADAEEKQDEEERIDGEPVLNVTFVTAAPSVAPTLDVSTEKSLDEMVDRVSVPQNKNNVPNASGPQFDYAMSILDYAREEARNWILTRDLLRDEILSDPTQIRFTQRYVLVLLLYAMQWNNNGRTGVGNTDQLLESMSAAEESECSWEGIFCEEVLINEGKSTTAIPLAVVRRIHWGDKNAIGTVVPELRSLIYLQEFNVSYNSLIGSIPWSWFETPPVAATQSTPEVEQDYYLPYLYLIDLGVNDFSGSVPPLLWTLPSLRFVYLSNNSLSGAFPADDFFHALFQRPPSSFLEDIWIDNNLITGSLPAWLFQLESLVTLVAANNELEESFPDLVFKGTLPPSLQVLDLSINNITGGIPPPVFESATLKFLFLDNNLFEENLPEYDPPIRSRLRQVWLHSNDLQGPIPERFAADWSNMEQLLLQNNALTGIIVDGCKGVSPLWPRFDALEADCTTLSIGSPVECVCCTTCF